MKVFRVAQIAPLSGQNAALGVWDSKGISLAAKQLNAKGNAYDYGIKFKIVHWDDQGDPTTANNLAQQAVSQEVRLRLRLGAQHEHARDDACPTGGEDPADHLRPVRQDHRSRRARTSS